MTTDRDPGRYNLHKLGWKAFEDLCVLILQHTLAVATTPFRMGADLGRDIFFCGNVSNEFARLSGLPCSADKTIVGQCKHSSKQGESLTMSILTEEVEKVRSLAADGQCDVYLVLSNRRLSSANEITIRNELTQKTGAKHVRILGEEWIESTIDGNFELLRRVPRLFGVGNLSQILSQTAAAKTAALIQDMRHELRTFVPTPSYMKAVAAFEAGTMVFLIGSAASGKSSIALNMCVTLKAEVPDLEVLRLRDAEELDQLLDPNDSKKVYWVDDVFGETRLDPRMATTFSRIFHNVRTASSAGCRFVFATRSYIYKAGMSMLRSSVLRELKAASVEVRVNDISAKDRERILYNHIKYGTIPTKVKTELRRLDLPKVARMPSFLPETARRLGDSRFHSGRRFSISQNWVEMFFKEPVRFFAEVLQELDEGQRASIALIMIEGNKLHDPIHSPPRVLVDAYGADSAKLRRSLESLRGSMVKIVSVSHGRYWQVHHPSMIDAMQEILADKPTMIEFYCVM